MSNEALALARARLHHLRLTGPPLADPVAVVRHLVAVQAQDVGPARWSIGQRLAEPSEAVVEAALARGQILRTHVLRPTWHFVLPEDLHVLLEVSVPRIRRVLAYYDRQNQVDARLISRASKLLGKALAGTALTRAELVGVLARGKLDAGGGQRMGHIMMHLELDGLVASGPPRGKQQTYSLVDETVPRPRRLPRAEALREVVRRYYASHGPATLKDLAWWASLAVSEIRPVVAELLREHVLQDATFAGHRCYFAGPAPISRTTSVLLVQAYDELSVGTSESKHVLGVAGIGLGRARSFNHLLFVGGQLAGRWKRTIRKDSVDIDVLLQRALTPAEKRGLDREAARQAGFLGFSHLRVMDRMS
jgi:hypothetical protein